MSLRYMLLGAMLLFVPAAAWAQIPQTLFSRVDIVLTPASPSPGESVVAKVTSTDEDIRSADVIWVLNDEIIAEGVGAVETSFTAGALGEETTIAVFVRTQEETVLNDSITVRPASVTVVWEANTYTPPFYEGRPLYTSGSTIRAQAYTDALDADGNALNASDLIYTWRRDTTVLGSKSGRGLSSITLPGPSFLGEYILSVEAQTQDGYVIGTAGARITTSDPEILLYEYSPLIGFMYHQAIGATHTFSSSAQTQVLATPYFMSAQNTSDSALLYDWRINGERVLGNDDNPALLTLQLDADEDVSTRAALTIDHDDYLLQSTQSQWQLSFEADARRSLFGF